jgi:hypothetical protein
MNGGWDTKFSNSATTPDMRGKKVGLFGFGYIGRLMAEKLSGFHVELMVYDPYITEDAVAPFGAKLVDKETLFKEADFISVHARLTPESHHAISANEIALMKPTAYFINTARAGLVDYDALLKALQEKAAQTGDAMDAQRANDLAAQCDRFEKKLYDLKLTRQVAIQMAPQIRLLQNNDSLLVERIQSTLSNTLPLWKSQMVLALGLHHSQQALQAQSAVTDMTNELLRKNAEALKIGTIQTAKEAERGIIDIETLAQTNQDLIDTINEVMTIQSEGRAKRMEAEKQLYNMEAELKKKLLTTHL